MPSEKEQYYTLVDKASAILKILDNHVGYESPDGGTCICSTTCEVCMCLYTKEIEELRKALTP